MQDFVCGWFEFQDNPFFETTKFDRINQTSRQEKEGKKRNQIYHGYSKSESLIAWKNLTWIA